MTLAELSKEYRKSALMLRRRIDELEEQRRHAGDTEAFRLGERISALRTMSYEAACAASALENYYDRRSPRHKYFSI